MKFIPLIGITFIFLFSCGPEKKESAANPSTSSGGPDSSLSKVIPPALDTLNPVLIAGGSEPGWYAQFFVNKLRLLYNNGQDSILIYSDFSGISETLHYKILIPGKAQELSVETGPGPCTEESSGKKREKTITIKINGDTLTGCADPRFQ